MSSFMQSLKTRDWRIGVILVSLLVVLGIGYSAGMTLPRPTPAPTATPMPPAEAAARRKIIMIIHGDPTTSKFWPIVNHGAEQAAQDLNLEFELKSLPTFDMDEMTRLIDEAIAEQPDGIVVTLPDVKALTPVIQRIAAAKIPFVINNVGRKEAKALGALVYIGQNEYEAGYAAGMKMAEANVKHAYCVLHQPGNAGIVERCQGFIDALTMTGGRVETIVIDRNKPEEARDRIAMGLRRSSDVDGLLITTNLPIALEAVQQAGRTGKVKVASFDFSTETLDNILNGKVLFVIDQQPYLQGYLPLAYLNLYLTNANVVPQDAITTGPGFITSENAALIKDLSAAGTR